MADLNNLGISLISQTEPLRLGYSPTVFVKTAITSAGALRLLDEASALLLELSPVGALAWGGGSAIASSNQVSLVGHTHSFSAADITSGILPIARGGTGVGTAPTNGQLLIGNGTGFALANLTAGNNITITNAAGQITISTTIPETGITSAFSKVANGAGTQQFVAVGEDTVRFANGTGLTVAFDAATKKITYTLASHTHPWTNITSPPTTIAGYGISDAYTKTNLQTSGQAAVHWGNLTNVPVPATRWPAWSEVTGKPGTFAPSSHTHPATQITAGNLSIGSNNLYIAASTGGGWSRGLIFRASDATQLVTIGAFGHLDTLDYAFIGSAYDNTALRVYPDNLVRFEYTPKVGITPVSLSDHLHDDRYLQLTGGTLSGAFAAERIEQAMRDSLRHGGFYDTIDFNTLEAGVFGLAGGTSTNTPRAGALNWVVTQKQYPSGYSAGGQHDMIQLVYPFRSNNNFYFRNRDGTGGTWTQWQKIWHEGNDGSDSGLDADTLDGQHAAAFATAGHTHAYLSLAGGTLTGDLKVEKNNPWFTLKSATTGGTTNEQQAGISIGESGYKGSAALHLVYTGDGYSYIGMGMVDSAGTGRPAYAAMKLHYQSNVVDFFATPKVNNVSVSLDGHTHSATQITDGDLGLGTSNINIKGSPSTNWARGLRFSDSDDADLIMLGASGEATTLNYLYIGSAYDNTAFRVFLDNTTTFTNLARYNAAYGSKQVGDEFHHSIVGQPACSLDVRDATITGALVIHTGIPKGSSTMFSIRFGLYEYSSNGTTLFETHGYAYTTSIPHPTKSVLGYQRAASVRLAYDASDKIAIIVGNVDSVWSYPKAWVSEVLLGHIGYSHWEYLNGWSIEYSTDITTNYTLTSVATDRSYVAFADSATLATTAGKWTTARTLTLTGAVTGSVSIDGSANVTLATTVAHNHDERYLKLTGGTLTGALAMSGYKVTNLGTPTVGTDAANKQYVDNIAAAKTTYSDLWDNMVVYGCVPSPFDSNGDGQKDSVLFTAGVAYINGRRYVFPGVAYDMRQHPADSAYVLYLVEGDQVGEELRAEVVAEELGTWTDRPLDQRRRLRENVVAVVNWAAAGGDIQPAHIISGIQLNGYSYGGVTLRDPYVARLYAYGNDEYDGRMVMYLADNTGFWPEATNMDLGGLESHKNIWNRIYGRELRASEGIFGASLDLTGSASLDGLLTVGDDLHVTGYVRAAGWTGNLDVGGNITLTGTVDGVDIAAWKTAYDAHSHTFASLIGKPTTLGGYGITDAASSGHGHSGVYVEAAGLSYVPTFGNYFVEAVDRGGDAANGRSVDLPTTQYKRAFGLEFKSGTTMGYESSYATLLTLAGYSDASAGATHGQLVFQGDVVKWRSGIYGYAWGAWKQFAFTSDIVWGSLAGTTPTTLAGYGITDAASISHNHDASHLTSGTVPNARLNGVYSGVTIKLDGTNTLFSTPSIGSPNSTARTVTSLAEFRNGSSTTTGAIVFIAPNASVAIMHSLEVVGMIYANGPQMHFRVQGYRQTASSAWSNTSLVNFGIYDPQVRWGVTPDGKNCLIIGDVATTWSYPHVSVVTALFSHGATDDNYAAGWTTNLVTDLTDYTYVTANLGKSTIVGKIQTAWELANGTHSTSLYGESVSYWVITANSNAGGLKFSHNSGTLKGAVYWNDTSFGLIGSDQSWRLRTWSYGTQLYGNILLDGVGNTLASVIISADAPSGTARPGTIWIQV